MDVDVLINDSIENQYCRQTCRHAEAEISHEVLADWQLVALSCALGCLPACLPVGTT
jgi:hypothetical protein